MEELIRPFTINPERCAYPAQFLPRLVRSDAEQLIRTLYIDLSVNKMAVRCALDDRAVRDMNEV
ncbi:hypothetical protein BDS110ZK25_23080 [Bradyrhizobium diazoefficiens]|uniref:Uncharacterized protein n=1 Tax=Bradyrhizobium diazoefficiens TaxID=1355477 RepID=A0A809XC07_9BRAD|nr:hypothetical protein F07S3_75440 [Bradyrhizobium diazoefficiens]BCA06764.1 hypothetical protein H12S4_76680 [Bradyrhizobium diazoefficiens]BCA15395.1 hypothetical protein BDHF08_72420 [Bradyrhizobium diazoefficiens]BCA24115.1 hypothetical protein BDHH15_73300 [Bradyrhizobium diazoefficiens]BCE24804.1 hypothetical protein XF1B_74850 [Bradyrhizobium diazoefficiens]